MKKLALLFSLCFTILFTVSAQPKADLVDADIKLFMSSFPKIYKDLEASQIDVSQVQGPEQAKALLSDSKVKALLEKNGWNANNLHKMTKIVSIYGHLKVKSEMDKLPAEQKEMIKNMPAEYQEIISGSAFHELDIAVVNKYYGQLDTILSAIQAQY